MPEQTLPPVRENRWTGMHHDSGAILPPGTVQLAKNFYLEDGIWRGRPGLDQLGSQLAASKVQGIFNFEELDGTVHVIAICNGDMYEYDQGADSWTHTDLSAQGVNMDANAHVSFANSRGRMIVTDGVNQPFMWDGSTFTVLNNPPVARGVTIYYDRVFFYNISGEEVKFEWSEEGDPTSGYDAKGYSWEFVQTDAGRVRGMAALNNALIVIKEDSAAQLRGFDEAQFQTDAVREGLSETEGTISQRGVAVFDGDVFFPSQEGPRVAVGGQRLVRVNEDENGDDQLRDSWADIDRSEWDDAITKVDSNRRHIWFAFPDDGFVLVYAVDEGAWQRFEFEPRIEALEEVEFTSGDEYMLIGDDNGNVYRYGAADQWDDSGVAVERVLRSRLHGREDLNTIKRLVEVHLTFELVTDVQFEVRANQDGDIVGSHTAGSLQRDDHPKYRRGLNAVSKAVGWELYHKRAGQTLDVVSAMSLMTRVGSYADF